MPPRRRTNDSNPKAPETEISSRSRQRKAKAKATVNICALQNGLHHMSSVNGSKKEKTEGKIGLANKLKIIKVFSEKKIGQAEKKPKTGILHVSDEKKEIIMTSSPTCASRKKVYYPLGSSDFLYFDVSFMKVTGCPSVCTEGSPMNELIFKKSNTSLPLQFFYFFLIELHPKCPLRL